MQNKISPNCFRIETSSISFLRDLRVLERVYERVFNLERAVARQRIAQLIHSQQLEKKPRRT